MKQNKVRAHEARMQHRWEQKIAKALPLQLAFKLCADHPILSAICITLLISSGTACTYYYVTHAQSTPLASDVPTPSTFVQEPVPISTQPVLTIEYATTPEPLKPAVEITLPAEPLESRPTSTANIDPELTQYAQYINLSEQAEAVYEKYHLDFHTDQKEASKIIAALIKSDKKRGCRIKHLLSEGLTFQICHLTDFPDSRGADYDSTGNRVRIPLQYFHQEELPNLPSPAQFRIENLKRIINHEIEHAYVTLKHKLAHNPLVSSSGNINPHLQFIPCNPQGPGKLDCSHFLEIVKSTVQKVEKLLKILDVPVKSLSKEDAKFVKQYRAAINREGYQPLFIRAPLYDDPKKLTQEPLKSLIEKITMDDHDEPIEFSFKLENTIRSYAPDGREDCYVRHFKKDPYRPGFFTGYATYGDPTKPEKMILHDFMRRYQEKWEEFGDFTSNFLGEIDGVLQEIFCDNPDVLNLLAENYASYHEQVMFEKYRNCMST